MHSSDVEVVFAAARRHGDNSEEPDHEVGDLQDLLRLAWSFMSDAERTDFMTHDTVRDILRENPGSDDTPAGEVERRLWKPLRYEESGLYCLTRVVAGGASYSSEVKRDKDGALELFHTNFKAKRRANALNSED